MSCLVIFMSLGMVASWYTQRRSVFLPIVVLLKSSCPQPILRSCSLFSCVLTWKGQSYIWSSVVWPSDSTLSIHHTYSPLSLVMAALCNRAGHYIFALWFLSIFLSFFSSPNLSGHRLDVYHTSTHGVAVVRIENAGLKCAARGSCKYRMQKSRQKSPSGHHRTTLSGYIFATRARIDNRKKLVKQQYLLHMSLEYGELRPSSG